MQWRTVKEIHPHPYSPVLVFSRVKNAAIFAFVSKNPEDKNDENLYWETPELPDGSKIYSLIMGEDLWIPLPPPPPNDPENPQGYPYPIPPFKD